MPFDEMGMSGKGTIKEYFTHQPYPEEIRPEGMPEKFFDDIEERDSAIDRLCVQLFTEFSGLGENEEMEVFWPETMQGVRGRARRKGLVMIGWQPDDPILALYKDGKAIAAFYASYRGVYQAGSYVAETNTHYFAHNFGDRTPQDTWIEDYEATCSQIAESFLLGRRAY